MFASARVAIAEFRVGFSPRSTGAAGARDFVALAAFFGLMSFLILLSWSVRDGLWGRFEQLLLGALPHGRAPVRISYHIDNPGKIDGNVIAAFESRFPRYTLVPHRSGDGASGPLILPGTTLAAAGGGNAVSDDEVWGKARSDRRKTEFRLEAHPLTSPLWRWIAGKAGDDAPDLSARSSGSRVVALNRHLFREHFRYDLYRRTLAAEPRVPCNLRQLLPDDLADIDRLRHIVLEVKENLVTATGERVTVAAYQAFRILWVDSFPTPAQIAMVVPLSTFELLLASADVQTLDLLAEHIGTERSGRFSKLRLAETDIEPEGAAEFKAFARCLGAVPADKAIGGGGTPADMCALAEGNGGDANGSTGSIGSCEGLRGRGQMNFPRLIDNGSDLIVCTGEHRRLRADEVAACSSNAGLPKITGGGRSMGNRLEVSEVPLPSPVTWLGPLRIAAPCSALGKSNLVLARALAAPAQAKANGGEATGVPAWIAACEQAKASGGPDAGRDLPAELHLLGYDSATVYLADAVEGGDVSVDAMTKTLLGWTTTLGRPTGAIPVAMFRLDEAYESALTRFGVLSLILDKVSLPLAFGGLALYIFLCMVILATAIDHRRRQYGLLLMTGIRPRTVGGIVKFQILLSCIVGGVFGYLAFVAAVRATDALLLESRVIADARMLIGLDVPSFLPVMPPYIAVSLWAGMTALAIVVGKALLWLQGITRAKAPIDLIKS